MKTKTKELIQSFELWTSFNLNTAHLQKKLIQSFELWTSYNLNTARLAKKAYPKF
jgi:hypothetical protein